MIGDGKNRIPTIHVRDLVKFVEKVIERPPKQTYIFAVDHNAKPTQLSLVQAISKGLGTGKVKHIDLESAAVEYDLFDVFSLDVRVRPSRVFDALITEGDEDNNDDDEDGVEKPAKFSFEWHAKEGIVANIAKLNSEFNEFRALKPNRVFLAGPPAAGKTFFAH